MSITNTIDIYEARSPVDQKELLRLIDEELKMEGFRPEIAVHVRNTASTVTVISVTPEGVNWVWTPKLSAFTANKGEFTLRKKA